MKLLFCCIRFEKLASFIFKKILDKYIVYTIYYIHIEKIFYLMKIFEKTEDPTSYQRSSGRGGRGEPEITLGPNLKGAIENNHVSLRIVNGNPVASKHSPRSGDVGVPLQTKGGVIEIRKLSWLIQMVNNQSREVTVFLVIPAAVAIVAIPSCCLFLMFNELMQ